MKISNPLIRMFGLRVSLILATAPAFAGSNRDGTTGREAVAAVRHDWKQTAAKTVEARQAGGRLPANFAVLPPEERLALLHARRDLNPSRYDRNHPFLGSKLALDDRLRAAQSQDSRPLNGLLPDNPYWRYMNFRRNINPARFDFYHATLGALIHENNRLRLGTVSVPQELIPPTLPIATLPITPGIPSPVPPVGGGPGVRLVPEPGSIALLLIGAAGLALPMAVRRWRTRPVAHV